MPGLIKKALNLGMASIKWIRAGRPLRSDEYIFELYDKCKTCPEFKEYSEGFAECKQCGCVLKRISASKDKMNKLAWPTEGCPLGHWKADVRT